MIPFCFINNIYEKDTNITNNLDTLLNQTKQMIKHYNEQRNDSIKHFDDKIKEIENLNQEINIQVNEVNFF